MSDPKYKVGNKVRIKNLDWYNEHKGPDGAVHIRGEYADYNFTIEDTMWCGMTMTIIDTADHGHSYIMKEDVYGYYMCDEMIEGLVEEECPQDFIEKYCKSCGTQRCDRTKEYLNGCPYYNAYICKKQNNVMEEEMSLDKAGQITDFEYEGLTYTLPEGYIFKDENGNEILTSKIILEKKKEYPKTYEECCKIIHSDPKFYVDTHLYSDTLETLYKLFICRDAYWKLYGEEIGLGKPWEPDWNAKDNHFYTIHTFNGKIECSATAHRNAVIIFPTEEMRDSFKKNFDPDIEFCKEFL